jgi:hypothetical protein
MKTLADILNILISMQSNLDGPEMRNLFGKQLGNHLFEKFVRYDRNIVYFYSALDAQHRKIFEDTIRSAEKMS